MPAVDVGDSARPCRERVRGRIRNRAKETGPWMMPAPGLARSSAALGGAWLPARREHRMGYRLWRVQLLPEAHSPGPEPKTVRFAYGAPHCASRICAGDRGPEAPLSRPATIQNTPIRAVYLKLIVGSLLGRCAPVLPQAVGTGYGRRPADRRTAPIPWGMTRSGRDYAVGMPIPYDPLLGKNACCNSILVFLEAGTYG